jgi:hypothetical protein
MSAAIAPTASPHGALADALLRRAVTAFAAVPPDDRGPLLTAIDQFLATPGPATYLAATLVLADARRTHALRQVRAAQTGYAFARGLDAVRRELGPIAAEALSAVPADERAGLRLRALALLAAAHRELAERVAGTTELLRKQLGFSTEQTPATPPPRRRQSVKRSRPAVRRRRIAPQPGR